ncbi:MAG TPA: thiamine-phosphate kinase [Planctomycetia bacterium]|nr:thiamine-phosphate kinase [Planctomycetia bacterium]
MDPKTEPSTSGEFAHIEWMRRRLAATAAVELGLGDDCAILRAPARLLVATDMLIEGVHFTWAEATPEAVGRKAMNVNLSDIAAMAGDPVAALVAVGLGPGAPADLAEGLFYGLQKAADRFGAPIIGGDTNRAPQGTVVCVTILGDAGPHGGVRRSGARPGDSLFVTGALGGSRAGKHLDFTPRLVEAKRLHERYGMTAAIDLSDGLGGDLFHVCRESRVGAVLFADRIPISPGLKGDPLARALGDGEDFELLFAVPRDASARLEADQPLSDLGVPVSRIGILTAEPEIWLDSAGVRSPLKPCGHVHAW